MRLQKYLADAGVASRRKCEEIIAQGRVKVNGKVVDRMGVVITGNEKIELDGRPVKGAASKLYLLFYKPRGVVCTVSDDRGRNTIMEYFKNLPRIYPVGRLDYDTEGLLIMTNDGEFANRLMHPRYQVKKRYAVKVRGEVTEEECQRLLNGVMLEDGPARADKLEFWGVENGKSYLRITVHEGRNRLIRRMCAAIGHEVARLKREGYGPLSLEGLKPGEYRHLSRGELAQLMQHRK